MSLRQKLELAADEMDQLKGKMKRLRKTNRTHVRHLQKLYADQGIIRYAELLNTPIEQWFVLQEGVTAKRIMTPTTSNLIFLCEFEAGRSLDWHQHDCFEMITLLDGNLQYVNHGVVKNSLILQPFETHSLTSEKGCKLIVQFWE